MKNIIALAIFCIFSLFQQQVYASDECQDQLAIHINLINESQEYFKQLSLKKKTLTSYEITVFKEYMQTRYVNLKDLQDFYNNPENNCSDSKTLMSAIAFYDMSLFGISVLKNTALRRIFKTLPEQFGYTYKQVKTDYKKYTSRKFVNALIDDIKKEHLDLPPEINIKKTSFWRKPKLQPINDIAVNAITYLVAGASRAWGYISDHVIWRDGHLNNQEIVYEEALKNLRPLDLIYEQRKFTLSNLTIPGHWGHVAVWLGTKEQLQDLGIWDQPFFEEFRAHIEKGENIIEMRKPGITFKSLKEFLNIDEFAITRIRNIEASAQETFYSLHEQLNREYDFRFDALSINRITCTELITFSYGDLNWKHSKTFFQVNIRPDDIAMSTSGQDPIGEFVLYVKGSKQGFEFKNKQQWSKLFGSALSNLKINKNRREQTAVNKF